MKKMQFFAAVLAAVFFAVPIMNAAAASKKDGSEVLIRRVDSNSMVKLNVFIDGKKAGALKVGGTSVFKVKNGVHTIYATAKDYMTRATEVSQFSAYNSRHIFSITDTSIVFIGQEPINSTQSTLATGSTGVTGLDAAIRAAFDGMLPSMKKAKNVAIINVASDNRAEGNYAIEELTNLAVNAKAKYKVIDRRKIESIRIAKNFDRTSDMEDDFIISIGSLLGADVVITGNLNGSGSLRRFRAKAIVVRTGQIIAMSSSKV